MKLMLEEQHQMFAAEPKNKQLVMQLGHFFAQKWIL